MKKNKNKAFTLAETLIVLSVIGCLLVLCARGISRIAIDKNLAKFKKAYTEIESTVTYLIQSELLYGTSSGFKDTDPVKIEDIGQIIGQNGISKFREAFKYRMHYTEDKINCPLYRAESSSGCFKTDFGVVLGIPDTEFVSKGTVKIKDAENIEIPAVPITIYTDYTQSSTVENDAIIVFVTYDGKLYFRDIEEIPCDGSSKKMHCNVKKYIYSTSIKNTD